MSQAPGFGGTPDSDHCSSAATRASCANSSARPTSPTIRVRPAMICGASSLHTASIVRCASAAVTPPIRASSPLPEIFRAEHLTDVTLAVAGDLPEPLRQLERLLLRPHIDQREADNHLLGLGERTVGNSDLAASGLDVRALIQPSGRKQHAGPGQLLHQFAHLGEHRLIRRRTAAVSRHQEPHRAVSFAAGSNLLTLCLRMRVREIDTAKDRNGRVRRDHPARMPGAHSGAPPVGRPTAELAASYADDRNLTRDGLAAEVLNNLGVTSNDLRQAVAMLARTEPPRFSTKRAQWQQAGS